jgi:hypothetical protein
MAWQVASILKVGREVDERCKTGAMIFGQITSANHAIPLNEQQ